MLVLKLGTTICMMHIILIRSMPKAKIGKYLKIYE